MTVTPFDQPDTLPGGDPAPDPGSVKLGALLGTVPSAPRLAAHVDSTVPIPASVHRSYRGVRWGMLGNDQVGDCVEAAILHAIEHLHRGAGTPCPPLDDQDALDLYSAITGYTPADPATDQGTDPVAAMQHWQDSGVPIGDGVDRIAGFAQVHPADVAHVKRAIWEFDAPMLCLSLPLSAQGQAVWDVVGNPSSDPASQPGSWGGHAVCAVSYDAHRVAVISWGRVLLATWRFVAAYGELVLAPLSRDALTVTGVSETGVSFSTLTADLAAL